MGLLEALARGAHKKAGKLYLLLYSEGIDRHPDRPPVEQHFLAHAHAVQNSGPSVDQDQLDQFEADALVRRAVSFGSEPAGFAFIEQVITKQWQSQCDYHFDRVLTQAARLTTNPLTQAAWTLRWCSRLGSMNTTLLRYGPGRAMPKTLAEGSAAALAERLGLSAPSVFRAAEALSPIEVDELSIQLVKWAREAG